MLLLSHLNAPSETLAYGCLLHDVAKPVCLQAGWRARDFLWPHREGRGHGRGDSEAPETRPRGMGAESSYLVHNHLRHVQAPEMRLSTLKRFLREDGIDELLELARIDALSSNGDLHYYQFCKERMAELKHEEIRPAPLLRGGDLIALGFTPGPMFAEILAPGGGCTARRRTHQSGRSARLGEAILQSTRLRDEEGGRRIKSSASRSRAPTARKKLPAKRFTRSM